MVMSLPDEYDWDLSTSTNTIHPLFQSTPSVGTTMAYRPRFIASPRAALMDAINELAMEVNSELRWNAVKLGTAIAIKMAAIEIVTNNSMREKPTVKERLFISSKPWCP